VVNEKLDKINKILLSWKTELNLQNQIYTK
jgi:hypothetical protein